MGNLLLAAGAGNWFQNLGEKLYESIFSKYQIYLKGFGNTVLMAVCAAALGIVLGVLIALVRYIAKLDSRWKVPSKICGIYVTVMRGTPIVLQLLLMSLVILVFVENGILIAIITFGLNSAAYVSEIFRSGLESVEQGQLEAGRSLGFGIFKTLWYIILPQAFRKSVPPIGNELIALIKETSVVGYVGIMDLTLAAQKITSVAFDVFIPLVFVGIIYLAVVMILSWLLKKLERRLAKSDRA